MIQTLQREGSACAMVAKAFNAQTDQFAAIRFETDPR